MYKLFRRISGSIFPRPDRPWDEDATSNAPQIGKKRRMSDDDDEPSTPSLKKSRTTLLSNVEETTEEEFSQAQKDESAQGVKEVTEGVREVEIDETKKTHGIDEAPAAEEAAAVPLPDSPVIEATATETSEPAAPEAIAEPQDTEKTAKQSDGLEVKESTKETTEEVIVEVEQPVEETGVKKDVVEEKETIAIATSTPDAEPTPISTQDVSGEATEPVDNATEATPTAAVAA